MWPVIEAQGLTAQDKTGKLNEVVMASTTLVTIYYVTSIRNLTKICKNRRFTVFLLKISGKKGTEEKIILPQCLFLLPIYIFLFVCDSMWTAAV